MCFAFVFALFAFVIVFWTSGMKVSGSWLRKKEGEQVHINARRKNKETKLASVSCFVLPSVACMFCFVFACLCDVAFLFCLVCSLFWGLGVLLFDMASRVGSRVKPLRQRKPSSELHITKKKKRAPRWNGAPEKERTHGRHPAAHDVVSPCYTHVTTFPCCLRLSSISSTGFT